MQPPNQHFLLSAKMNGMQRRTLVHVNPWKMHCMYCGMPKGTSQAKTTLNWEKIKLVALEVILVWRHQSVSQSVGKRNFCSNFLKEFQVNLKVCLSLHVSNQYCPIIAERLIEAVLSLISFFPKRFLGGLTLHHYYGSWLVYAARINVIILGSWPYMGWE